jgi:hypothetical protein
MIDQTFQLLDVILVYCSANQSAVQSHELSKWSILIFPLLSTEHDTGDCRGNGDKENCQSPQESDSKWIEQIFVCLKVCCLNSMVNDPWRELMIGEVGFCNGAFNHHSWRWK